MEQETHSFANTTHRYFGMEFNNRLWGYFGKENKTEEDYEDMKQLAYASLLHWKIYNKSTMVNVQRGFYMIAKAFCYCNEKGNALKYAQKCFDTAEKHEKDMADFDFAYANEIMYRAHELNGNNNESIRFKQVAEKLGNAIEKEKDKKYFLEDLKLKIY